MSAYLIVDVDDLLQRFASQGITVEIQELAVGLRGGAALAAGLMSADRLKAIAVANWQSYKSEVAVNPQAIFRAAGYEVFDLPNHESIADALIIHYFSYDPDPVDELILASTSQDLLPLINRIHTTQNARIRMWGSEDVLQGTEFADEIIFQPLESLLGIQTKNVAVYIDFENITISLSEQGFVVNLDQLIDSFVKQARAYGQVVKMAAYAPWGQRGALPPLVDKGGREVADDAPTRLMFANIDPVFNLPGKNSADVRIARDVLSDSGHVEAADVYIMATGDRDFNDVINFLLQRNKHVVLWGVRGSTSRQLEKHPTLSVEYVEDFTPLETYQSLSHASTKTSSEETVSFVPSQWTSVIIQFDRLVLQLQTDNITKKQLINQLIDVGAVVSAARGDDLVSQAISLGLLKAVSADGRIVLDPKHPVVETTRLIRDSLIRRVENTLEMRGWEYVNYGFLLKGMSMEKELDRPGVNDDDQWRSHWVDCLVRERVLQRDLIPHRQNPEDLVPVIRLRDDYTALIEKKEEEEDEPQSWAGISLEELSEFAPDILSMAYRVIVSVEQFTSFRSFAWCPLGSLHRRLRAFDAGVIFQQSVEYLTENGVTNISEYTNPQSNYNTKGISLNNEHPITQHVLGQRNEFIQIMLQLYEQNILISQHYILENYQHLNWDLELWFSIMETENVLNLLPGRTEQYSLFRTHHTVKLIAGDDPNAE